MRSENSVIILRTESLNCSFTVKYQNKGGVLWVKKGKERVQEPITIGQEGETDWWFALKLSIKTLFE